MNDSDFTSIGAGTSANQTEISSSFGFDVDFSRAKKLPNTGVTCDIYSYTYGAKHFLIKRIREEHRNKPVVWAAFEKEFEIGLNLTHQGLPIYRSRGKDFIVMDYVDGVTLSAMIQTKDPWLSDPANIRQMLIQLVEVVDYLHQKNVVHCDIKCDNVMITAGTRNVVLIDLGGAYTFADYTNTGDPRAYGLDLKEDLGSPDIDFHGIGMIVDRLASAGFPCGKFSRFRRLCDKRGVTPAQLLDALKPQHTRMIITAAIVSVAIIAAFVFIITRPVDKEAAPNNVAAPSMSDTVVIVNEPPKTEKSEPTAPIAPAVSVAPDYKSIIEKEMVGYFKPVEDEIAEMERLLASGTATDRELLDQTYKMATLQNRMLMDAYQKYQNRFPDIDPVDIQLAVGNSKAYKSVVSRLNTVTKAGADEMKRRHPESYGE